MQVIISATKTKDFLDWQTVVYGQPLWQHYFASLKTLHCRQLLFITKAENLALRQAVRRYALTQKMQIRVLSQEVKQPTLSQDLLLGQNYLAEKFFFLTLNNWSAVFQAQQLQNYQADFVGATDKDGRFLDSYLLNREFVKFLSQSQPDLSWEKVIENFTDEFVVKFVNFETQTVMPKNSDEQLFYLLKKLFPSGKRVEWAGEKNYLAPTARLIGPVFLAAGVKIGEYSLIEGPCYLGKNCQIGNFCHLSQQTVMEAETKIADYVQLNHCYLAPKTKINHSFQSWKNKVWTSNHKTKEKSF